MSGPRRKFLLCFVSIILLSVCSQGQADTAKFGNGGDTGYESSTVDDVEIQFSEWNNNTVNNNFCYITYNSNEDTSCPYRKFRPAAIARTYDKCPSQPNRL